jgi:hypothetical protein
MSKSKKPVISLKEYQAHQRELAKSKMFTITPRAKRVIVSRFGAKALKEMAKSK